MASLLDIKNIEHYCPLNKVTKQWSDRKKVIEEPLFKGYVFVCIEENKKWDVSKTDGVLNFVYWLGKPAVVKDSDIKNIRKFLNEFDDVQLLHANSTINVNEKVIVKQGLLMNYKGIVIEVNGRIAKVKIDELGIILTATFEKQNLEIIK